MKELTVQQIADLHGRTVYGVMSKLQAEGLIDSSWNNARGWVFQDQGQSQGVSLQPALQFDQDDDDEVSEYEEQDDPEDEDYVPEDEEEEDDAEDDEEEFDPYSMKQKVAFLEQQITNIFSFLQKQFPKQKVMAASM
jgi:DNA-binding PadR family transcriptional regulator